MARLVDEATEWGWGVALGATPWLVRERPSLAPVLVAIVLATWPLLARLRGRPPWGRLVVVASALVFLVTVGGVVIAVGWTALTLVVAALAVVVARRGGARPDAADLVALAGWSGAFALRPALVGLDHGGWLAPALLVVAARSAVGAHLRSRWVGGREGAPGPPSRDAHGTLSLQGVVVRGEEATPCTVPLELELRAGASLSILCESVAEASLLGSTIAGIRPALAGEVVVDGEPLAVHDRLVAVVAPGERFVLGSLEENLGVLCDEAPDPETLATAKVACGLDEVVAELGGGMIGVDGAPLSAFQRLLVLAARVVPSSYRLLVVVDPMVWVEPALAEAWRRAVVRASLGRTAVWLTGDCDLAGRAGEMLELRDGALRRPSGEEGARDG